jgi:hypothetical protein
MDVAQLGKLLVALGLGVAGLGLILWGISAVAPGVKLGRLPGDLAFGQGGTRVYVPLTTMILLSAALTLVLWLVSQWRK